MKGRLVVVALMLMCAGSAFAWGVRIAQPLDGSVSTIASLPIMYQFERAGEVNPSTIVLSINGVRYNIYDPQLVWSPAHLTFTPSVPFAEGAYACTLFARTISGEEVEGTPLITSFAIDLHGPYVVARELECTGCVSMDPLITTNRTEKIIFYIRDDYARINPNTVAVMVEGIIYNLSSPALDWTYPYRYEVSPGETLEVAKIVFDPSAIGISWNPLDTVVARFYSADDMPYYGSANHLQIRDINEIIFYVDANPPSAEILYPHISGARTTWTSCRDQGFALRVWDESGIDPYSIRVQVQTRILTISDPEVTFDTLTGTFAYSPLLPYSNGEEVHVRLISATDKYGNVINPEVAPSWSFIIDQTGPRVTGHYPPNDYVTTNITEHVWFTIRDTIGVVDPMSIRLVMESSSGERFVYTGIGVVPDSLPEILWDGEKYEFCPELADTYWNDGDTIYVTVEDALDSAAFCGANHSTNTPYTWAFIVAAGPKPEVVFPKDGTTTSCTSQDILIYLHDRNGIDPESVLLEVEGKVFGPDSFILFIDTIRVGGVIVGYDTTWYYPLSVHDSTVEFHPPENWYVDGQQVDYVLLRATDMLGNDLAGGPVRVRFIVDKGNPRVASTDPPAMGYVKGPSPRFSITMFDSLSTPVDSTTLVLRVAGIYYRIPNPGLHCDGTHIFFDGEEAGVTFGDQEIEVCIIEAYDAPDYRCSYYTNPLLGVPYCYNIIVDNTPPTVSVVEPSVGGHTACPTQDIKIRITDPAGIDPESIIMTVNGRIYNIHSPNVSFTDGILTFTPSTAWRNNQLVHWSLVQVSDRVGNILNGTPISGTFLVDLTGPVVTGTVPENGAVLNEMIHRIAVNVYDAISDVNYTTAEFTITYGEEVHHTTYADGFIGYDAANHRVSLDLDAAGIILNRPGVVANVSFKIYDNVDYACPEANSTTYEFSFTVNPGWAMNLLVNDSTYVLRFGGRLDASAGYDDGIDVQAPPSEPGARRPAFVLGDGTRLLQDYRDFASPSEVWVVATGDSGGTIFWNPAELPTTGSFLLNGTIDMRTTNRFTFAAGTPISITYNRNIITLKTGWNLVSVPVVPDDPSVASVFPTVESRNIWAYDAVRRRYYNPTQVEPGTAYWVLSFEYTSYTVPGTPLPSYTVRLPRGWNLIGSVYNFSGVDFTDPNDYPNGSIVGPAAYSYNPLTRAYTRENKIVAGYGYWVLVRLPSGFTYCELTVDAGIMAGKRIPSPLMRPDWEGSITIGTTNLVFGGALNATNDFDLAYDELLPPALVFAGFDAYLGDGDMRYSKDIRNDGIWHLYVSSASPAKFELNNLPEGTSLVIDNTELVGGSGEVNLSAGSHMLKLVSKALVPSTFVLKQNTPNPFNPVTAIEYGLPTASHVTIEIYNILGEHIRKLVDADQKEGTYRVEWDGTDSAGRQVNSGVYFYRMSAGNFHEIRKMTLLK